MSRMDLGYAASCPVLTSISEEAKETTAQDLEVTDHPINLRSVSGKRAGMSVMIGEYIYVASGAEPSDAWIKMPRAEKAKISVSTVARMSVPSGDISNPVHPTGFVARGAQRGLVLMADGSVRNNTGKLIYSATGTFTIDVDKASDGLGTSLFYIWSEYSSDGVIWAVNQYSLRRNEVDSSGESTYTYTFFMEDWNVDVRVRLAFGVKSGSAINIRPVSEQIGTEIVRGTSLIMTIEED